jgi:hypothetical protein
MPRPDKRSSLTLLTNERLRELAEELELSPMSGMRHDELVQLLARSKRATFESVLGVLKRAELKEVCRRHGLDDGGKAKEEIVARILGGGGRGSAKPGRQMALALEGEVEDEANAEGFKGTKKLSRKSKRGEETAEIVVPVALAPDTATDATEAATLALMSTNSAAGQGSMGYEIPPSVTGAEPGGRGEASDGSPPHSVSFVPESTPASPEGVGVAPKTAKKKRRSANVPGQFYGYSLQITRFVAHFLHAHQGQSVSLEHLDDVATHSDQGIIAEQDKSGFKQNPVSDRSVELWKTLANWVRAIRDGALKSDTKFRLYVAQGHLAASSTASTE